MLLSIVMPVYNVAKYIDRAIRSIVDQSCQDWELILVDDGSSDGSSGIVDAWGQKDGRIRVYHQPNGGASRARNTGLRHCSGDYIYFVDADDYVGEGLFSEIAQKIKETRADLILVNAKRFYAKGKVREPDLFLTDALGNETLQKLLLCGYLREPFIKVCKSSIIKGKQFQETLKSANDFAFTADIMTDVKTCACTEKHFYYYNKANEKSLTKTKSALQANVCDFMAVHRFAEFAKTCHWESLDSRLPRYYQYWCNYYGLYLFEHPDMIGENNQVHQRILHYLEAQGIHGGSDEVSYKYKRLYYAYEAYRLGWEICQTNLGIWEPRSIRAMARYYCANLAYGHENRRDEIITFLRFIRDRHGEDFLSFGQKCTLKMIEWGMDMVLRRKGRKILQV